MDILSELTSKDDNYAYEVTKKIIIESQTSNKWYKYFNDFVSLLKHPKALVRNRAINIIAANIRWDDEKKFDVFITEFLTHITDDKPITARQCIQSLAKIGKIKHEYIPVILSALENADLSKYKDSMRPLIEKDIEKTKKELIVDSKNISFEDVL